MSLLVSLLLGPSAFAFAPTDDIHIGMEPDRVVKFTPNEQLRMRNSPAWQDFLQGEGAGWLATWDEQQGTIHRAWGAGIDLGPVETKADLEAAVMDFFERNPGLAGVQTGELRMARGGYVERSDTWAAQLERVVNDVPVYNSGVKVILRYGKLVMFDAATHPGAAGVDTVPALSAERAVDVLIQDGPEPGAEHEVLGAKLSILPLMRRGLEYVLTWEVRTATHGEPPGLWVGHVDARTGELLNVYNEVRFLGGTIYATHDTRAPDGSVSTSPAPFVRVSNGSSSTYTDAVGAFSLSGGSLTTTLENSEFFDVRNASGREGEGEFSGSSFTWTDADATIAEIDTLIFLSHVRAWALEYAPDVRQVTDDLIESNVNVTSGSCNAYWNGTVNFYEREGSCNNTGRIADVNYHEWGHGLHYYSLLAGSFDSSMSEGIGDVTSHLQTDDSVLAPYFYTSGSGIRNADNSMRYPENYSGNDVHSNGTIFSGAMWDFWEELEGRLGDRDAAQEIVSQVFADGIKFGPSVEGSYDAMVAADDDDGDLSNGTPNICSLVEAFSRHGLGPGSTDDLVQLQHEPIWSFSPWAGDHPVRAEIANLAPECAEISTDGARIFFSTDGGDTWESNALETLGDEAIEGVIPEQPDGTVVHYYFELSDGDGDIYTAPSGGAINPFSFFVGNLIELYCEDFETSDGSYTHDLLDGEYSNGADDWQHGVPNGKTSDPNSAWSGNQIWGNDLGFDEFEGNAWNGEYQSDKHNQLASPSIDISGASEDGAEALVLQFARYLGVEDGYYDQALITVDGETIWSNHDSNDSDGGEHHLDDQWGPHTQLVEDLDGDGALNITWDLVTDGGLEFGGWNVDDVCVYGWIPTEDTGNDGDGGDGGDDGGSDGDDTGDVGGPGGDTTDPGDGGAAGGDDGGVNIEDDGTIEIIGKGCACSAAPSGSPSPLSGLFGLALGAAALVRRRR